MHGPDDAAADLLPSSPVCPFCGGCATELVCPFGSKLSVATYWCRACRTGFEYVKWAAAPGAGGVAGEGVRGKRK